MSPRKNLVKQTNRKEESIESLANGRKPRINAGSKMDQLLHRIEENNEDELSDGDEIYNKLYGGFQESSDDSDFDIDQCLSDSSSSENLTDSDDLDDEEKGDSKSKATKSKNLKNPKKRKVWKKVWRKTRLSETLDEEDSSLKLVSNNNFVENEQSTNFNQSYHIQFRESTLKKRKIAQNWHKFLEQIEPELLSFTEIQTKQKQDQDLIPTKISKMTQEQMLEEAKITEIINQRSLNELRKMRVRGKNETLEKRIMSLKRNFLEKNNGDGSMITYHSFTQLVQDGDDVNNVKKIHRNMILFPDDESYRKYFHHQQMAVTSPPIEYCPITGKVARYRDPLTGVGYHDSRAFCLMRTLLGDYLLPLEQQQQEQEQQRLLHTGKLGRIYSAFE